MNAELATAKLSVMVTPEVKRRLEDEASAKKTTVGDLVRRRLDGDPGSDTQLLVEALSDLARRAQAVGAQVDAVHAEVEHALATQTKREAAIRKTTTASLSASDRAALAALFAERRPAMPGAGP